MSAREIWLLHVYVHDDGTNVARLVRARHFSWTTSGRIRSRFVVFWRDVIGSRRSGTSSLIKDGSEA